jgi:hypothetical protein
MGNAQRLQACFSVVITDMFFYAVNRYFTDFWSEIEEVNGTLQLPDGVYWMGHEEQGSTLFVRECYKELWNMIQELVQSKVRRIVIIGIPGIGKTCFLKYLLYFLKKQGATVVLENLNRCYLLTKERALFGSIKGCYDELDDPNTWFESE